MDAPREIAWPARITLEGSVRPTRAEVDLDAIRHNVRVVRDVVGQGVPRPKVYGVVKADGYGHGATAVARAMEEAGAEGLCVALVEEGVELREAGVTLPVLVMSGIYRDGVEAAVRAGLTPVLHDPSLVPWVVNAPGPVRVHLKVDTGMSRLGVTMDQLPDVALALAAAPHVEVEGLMTHFANADMDDPDYTFVQMERFATAVGHLARAGIHPKVWHAANSAAAFRLPETRLDLVRVGIAHYGVAPFPHAGPGLLPAMRLRTEIIALREVGPGTPVGYCGAYRTGRRAVLATVPIGYADGFFRRLSSEAQVLVRGARCNVVGNVSMDLSSVDVTDLARTHGVEVGDEVVLLGAQSGLGGAGLIRAEEVAQRVGTIPYEVLTAVSRRVPRSYRAGSSRG